MASSGCKKCIKLHALLRGITSKHDGDYYCSNSLHSFRTQLKTHEKVFKNYDFYRVIIHEKFDKTLKYNQGQKSMKICYYK